MLHFKDQSRGLLGSVEGWKLWTSSYYRAYVWGEARCHGVQAVGLIWLATSAAQAYISSWSQLQTLSNLDGNDPKCRLCSEIRDTFKPLTVSTSSTLSSQKSMVLITAQNLM